MKRQNTRIERMYGTGAVFLIKKSGWLMMELVYYFIDDVDNMLCGAISPGLQLRYGVYIYGWLYLYNL
jgi:predicted Rdx family selenoprotein